MSVFLVILSSLLWLAAIAALLRRPVAAPALSYLGLLILSFAKDGNLPLLPISPVMLWAWLAMTVVVSMSVLLQPQSVRKSASGTGYMAGGAITGLAIGLLGFTLSANLGMLYGIMVVAVAAGTFLGFLLFSRTPKGTPFAPASGRFFNYLLAKGFPTAITVMQIGVALVLAIALQKFVNP